MGSAALPCAQNPSPRTERAMTKVPPRKSAAIDGVLRALTGHPLPEGSKGRTIYIAAFMARLHRRVNNIPEESNAYVGTPCLLAASVDQWVRDNR
jgi:hypothetical protein